ncbi:MAG: alpha-galactosidase [Anaerolineae bacterium]
MTLQLESPSFDLHWSPSPGIFHFQSPGRSISGKMGVEVKQGRRTLCVNTSYLEPASVERREIEDVHGSGEELEIQYQESQGLVLAVYVRTYVARPFTLIRVEVFNKGPETVYLERFFFESLPDTLKAPGKPTGFYRTDWQSWSPASLVATAGRDFCPALPMRFLSGPMMHNARTPWARKPCRFWSESVGALVTSQEALVAGGASLADQFVQTWVDLRPGHLEMRVQAQCDEVPLGVGEARTSEWFYLEWVPFPNHDPLAQYAYAVVRQMDVPQVRSAPVGWSSWYIFWAEVAESDMMDNLATAALLADEIPLDVIQLDQGYEPIWGDWTERNERFPHSLDWLADRIEGSHFTPGLWLGPLTVHPRSRLATEHPDWLLRNHRGRPVSAGLIANHFIARALDPTHPGVGAYLRELIETAVGKWGYTYLKLDFLYAGALPGKRHNPNLTRAQAYRHALRIIRDAAGEACYLVGCGAPLGPSIGLVDAMRIGPDTAPYWEPRIMGIRRPFRNDPTLPSLRNSLRNVETRAWIHGRWWINDPDNLMIRDTRTSLTEAEVLSQVTMAGLSGGLTMLSDHLPEVPAERRALVAALLPPMVEGMDVLDLFHREMPREVVAPMARPWGNWQLVGLFNWSEEIRERDLPRALPGFDVKQDYHIVDFWNRRYQRLETGSALPKFSLPPHGCVLLGVRPVRLGPHLVATTFHISQGGEVVDFDAGRDRVILRLQLDRVAEGAVWLALPAPPKEAYLDDVPLTRERIHAVAQGVWAIDFLLSREGTLRVVWQENDDAG